MSPTRYHRGNRAGDFRQLVVSILPPSSRCRIVIMGFTPCKCGWNVVRRLFLEIKNGQATIFGRGHFE